MLQRASFDRNLVSRKQGVSTAHSVRRTLSASAMYAIWVQIYKISAEVVNASRGKTYMKVLKMAALYAPIYLAVGWLWPSLHGRDGLTWLIVNACFQGLLVAGIWVWLLRRSLRRYEISVDDEEIRVKFFMSIRSIHRGKIRTLLERKEGLLISGRNRIGTFLWGGIWVPRQLPEYEELKRLAESWKTLPN
jgi:hypothetical protein